MIPWKHCLNGISSNKAEGVISEHMFIRNLFNLPFSFPLDLSNKFYKVLRMQNFKKSFVGPN